MLFAESILTSYEIKMLKIFKPQDYHLQTTYHVIDIAKNAEIALDSDIYHKSINSLVDKKMIQYNYADNINGDDRGYQLDTIGCLFLENSKIGAFNSRWEFYKWILPLVISIIALLQSFGFFAFILNLANLA